MHNHTMTKAQVLQDPLAERTFDDWGEIPDMIEGVSRTFGTLLHRGEDGSSECGIWNCTPGIWKCSVTRDEFCHFISGRCIYTQDSGDVIAVRPGTLAFFPRGWQGICKVTQTIRKVYMIR